MRQTKFGRTGLKTVPGNIRVALGGKPVVAPRFGIGKNLPGKCKRLIRSACTSKVPGLLQFEICFWNKCLSINNLHIERRVCSLNRDSIRSLTMMQTGEETEGARG
ncbi:hypothetical protein [Rhizobium sp. R635]|uniref:hypothetical protein n=1 Tax=Rhizobium sp. R635 TaxID=1764275 RepID=UPI001FD8C926|nr:hypothetical protein [Rhizobium sp. R635]